MNTSAEPLDQTSNDLTTRVQDLDKELESCLESSREVVDILLTVTDFKEVLHTHAADRGTAHNMSMKRKHPYVSFQENGKIDTLKIKEGSGPLIFKFTLTDAVTKDVYYPLGIAFEKDPSDHESSATAPKHLPAYRTHVFGRSLYVTEFTVPRIRYKFSVVFQRKRDGKIAIIDPVLEPDNTI